MKLRTSIALLALVSLGAFVAACGGGGGSGGYGGAGIVSPGGGGGVTTNAQVVSLALPTTAMGTVNDPTFGLVGGFTQAQYSQVLGFSPGAQIMIYNAQTSTQHTLGDTGGHGSFPSSATLSTTASGGATLSSGFQSGAINPGVSFGPITLTTGTYYIGCAFHYSTNAMRDVLVVAAGAAPGPQATQPPGTATPVPVASGVTGGSGGYSGYGP